MKREKFQTRTITLVGKEQLNTLLSLAAHLPLDADKPLEAVIREKQPARKLDQNALMWVGPLADIAEQAYVHGRTYSAEVWHRHFKELYLPGEYDSEMCKSESYKKWDFDPRGARVLVGSTTDLTVKGFSVYLEMVHAFGANLGVQFHVSPNEGRRAA